MQFAFSSQNGSAFEGKIAFGTYDYANIDFLESTRRDVPLHLSFRMRRQVMVYNQFLDGTWGPEQPIPISAAPDAELTVRIEFFLGKATVMLDGVKLGVFELPDPSDGTDETIHWVSLNGGFVDVQIEGEAHDARTGRGILYSDRPFILEGWGFDPAAMKQDLAVSLVGTGQSLPVVTLPEPDHAREQQAPTDRIGVMALVPGWVWTYAEDPSESVVFQLTANGRPCGAPIELTREEVAGHVEAICGGNGGKTSLDVLTALEHAKFAEIANRVSPEARNALVDAAQLYRVSTFFTPEASAERKNAIVLAEKAKESQAEQEPASAAAPIPLRDDLAESALLPFNTVWKTVLRRMATATPDEMADVLREAGVTRLAAEGRRNALRFSARGFCYVDRFEDLYALAIELGDTDIPPGTDTWGLLCALPFQYMNENAAALSAIFEELPSLTGYIETCSLSWTLRRVLLERPSFISEELREEMLSAFFDYAQTLEPEYDSLRQSEMLVAVAVTAIQTLPTLSDAMQERAVSMVRQLYAYSQQFWTEIAALQSAGELPALPELLQTAQARFERLHRAVSDGVAAEGHSAVRGETSDAIRVRRELAAAAQADGMAVHDVLGLAKAADADGLLGDDALLRHMAFPADVPEMPELADASQRAIHRSTPGLPQSLYLNRQKAAGQVVRQLLERPVTDADRRATLLDRFFDECALLSSYRNEYLGYALPVSLLAGALTNSDTDLAAELPGRLQELLKGLEPGEIAQLCAAPALRNALWSLRQAPMAKRSPSAQAIFDVFELAVPHLAPEFEAQSGSLVPKSGLAAFYGVLVVVYSCRANLDTRVAEIRENWLRNVEAMGVPHIVVVGDGAGELEGDVVALNTPDDYISLPRKSIEMTRWVVENTGFPYLYKIDDDCFLDAEQAIGSLSYAKYGYYGRLIRRIEGSTDRLWHHVRGAEGNQYNEIDKSPEPSEYADGGTGYFLNRAAMQSLVSTTNSRHGAWLQLCSFMEDKLIGDLLALGGVTVSHRDYHSVSLRRPSGQAPSVSVWQNGFLPSAASPTLTAHLDNSGILTKAADLRTKATLEPKRLWPSFQPLNLGWRNLQVELVSPLQKMRDVNSADLCVVATLRNELKMLPMFLEHYRKLGVTGFLIADNLSDDGTLEYLVEQDDVATFAVSTDYGVSRYGVAWQQTLVSQLRMNRWSLVADADEFLVLPDHVSTLPDLLGLPEFEGADCARIFMLDMYPEGDLAEATLETGDPFTELTHCEREPFNHTWNPGTFDNGETWTSGLRHRLMQDSRPQLFAAQKYPLMKYKPWMRFPEGLHYAAEIRLAPRDLMFAHFKYHADFYRRAQIETSRGQHFNNAEEYRKYLALKNEGRSRIYEPGISVPWRECDWVRKTLAPASRQHGSEAAE